ncbi:Icc protein [Alkalispirochaeta americana]|uniref:Icc protein n=1 Tax=Alkalispirochaeta americana TaxID=159291 RepID=A0A1N6PBX4_9SPIO|nr:metallophosphoesterase [Alkalispirochaeta americana]SIQ01769.1 Icc protein [Alkalispirochaeta americana]
MIHNRGVRCVHISDIHLDLVTRTPQGVPVWDHFFWARKTARNLNPDLVVITGDLALDQGSEELYQELASHLVFPGAQVLLLPGNHDKREYFQGAFGRRYALDPRWPRLDRVVEIGGRTMILLDTADGEISRDTLSWLDSLLTASAAAVKRGEQNGTILIWMHHPPLGGFNTFMDANYPLRNGQELVSLLTGFAGVLRFHLFCGHYHTDDQRHQENLTQYSTPSTWIQLDATTPDFSVSSRLAGLRLVDIDSSGTVETLVIEQASETLSSPADS